MILYQFIVSPNLNELNTPAFCPIAPWVLEATWHAIERRCRLNALHNFHQWGLSASIGSFLWCGGTSFAIHHQIHGICIVETSWLRFPWKFHACHVLVELVDVSLGRCIFFALGQTPNVPYESRNPTEKCLILEGSGMVPSHTAGENVRALWLPRVRGKKWRFCPVAILRLNPSAKLFFACGQATVDRSRHEDLLLAARVPPRTSEAQRTHQMAHMMWPTSRSVKMADPFGPGISWISWNLGEKRLKTDSKSPRWDFENP